MSPTKNDKKPLNSLNKSSESLDIEGEIMTFGPKGAHRAEWQKVWHPAWLWSKNHGYEDTFRLLVDVFNLQDKEIEIHTFRNIIDILTHPHTISLLEFWSINDEQCNRLYKMAKAARNDLDINQGAIASIGIVTRGLVSSLPIDKFYLLQIFLLNVSHEEDKYNEWMLTVRIWMLVHAMYRAEIGKCLDGNLKAMSSYLRGLLDKSRFDWDDFLLLQPASELKCNFVGMNSQFSHTIASLRAQGTEKRLSLVMGAIERVARGDDGDYKVKIDNLEPQLYVKREIKENFILSEDDEYWLPVIPHYSTNEFEDDFVEARVEPKDSYVYQKLSAKSRLIAQQEHLHYLPWSWDRLTQLELDELEIWIEIQLLSKDEKNILLATMVWIAINIGRTLIRVLDINISDDIGTEWTLNSSTLNLQRTPPKRENTWEPKTDEQNDWILPIAYLNEVTLPDESTQLINSLTKNNKLHSSLAEYWCQENTLEIEVAFNKVMKGKMKRIKSGMLANVLPQRTFDNTNNGNLSQMVSFHPQNNLPGSFAYGSWPCAHIKNVTKNIHQCIDAHLKPYSGKVIAFGSRVNPKEQLLKNAIKDATNKINTINANDNPIEFHNAYVSYLVVSLWAGTGVRPVGDSFESPLHFNFDEGFVFVNDKACDERHMGRLVPVPNKIITILRTTYIKHLSLLAEGLRTINETLSNEINYLINNTPSGKLPYFFHIEEKSLDWKNIYPEKIDNLNLFEWPLRINLFRQRLAKKLPDLGVEQELVNAWFGHKNTKIESFGDYSIRCWIDDLRKERVHIDTSFESLGFTEICTWNKAPNIPSVTSAKFDNKLFGIKSRENTRRKKHDDIISETKNEIKIFLNGRKISTIEQQEVDELEKIITVDINGKPQKNILVRFGVFNDCVDEAWEEDVKKFDVKKRFIIIQDDFGNVKGSVPQNFSAFKRLKVIFDDNYKYKANISIEESKLLCVFALMFENRICYRKMLEDVYNQINFRLVKYKNRYYLEYNETLDLNDYLAPIQRHLVSEKTAFLLDKMLGSKIRKFSAHKLCYELDGKLKGYNFHTDGSGYKEIINRFCDCIDSANKIEFPGVIGGFLSGRVLSCSLNWFDWIRLEQNKILNMTMLGEVSGNEDVVTAILKSETLKVKSRVVENIKHDELLINAKLYVNEIKAVLKGYNPNKVNKILKLLHKVNSQHKKKVSSAILFMGYWIKNIIKKGKSKRNIPYQKKTIVGYFSSFTHSFQEIAYDKELIGMLSEDMTDLYNNFLSSTDELKGTYHADRLLSFHDYCHKIEGVSDPVWEELNLPEKERMSSPGFIKESDYIKILDIILSNKDEMYLFKLHMAFLLFLCFRFGLRSMEAIGLRRCDWIQEKDSDAEKDDITYVLVINNSIRKLKNKGSRRIVPLLFSMNEMEKKLVIEVMGQYEAFHHDDNMQYLFSLSNMKINKDIDIIRRSLILLLRKITGNPKMVTHHLRHSFSNITSFSLYHLKLNLWNNVNEGTIDAQKIKDVALGQNITISLRSSICAARLLGHTHPRTDAVSYQHFYGEWANEIANVCNDQSSLQLDSAIEIDKVYNLSNPIDTQLAKLNVATYNETTLPNLIKVMSLVSNGLSFYESTILLRLNPLHIKSLEDLVVSVDKKMVVKLRKSNAKRGEFEILERIHRSSWQRLICFVDENKNKILSETKTELKLEEVVHLIGKTRQLTAWEEKHLYFIKRFITFFDVKNDYFNIASYNPNSPVIDMAVKYNLQPNLKKHRSDLDPGVTGSEVSGVFKDRINIIFKENKDIGIRNGYQLVVCLIAYYVALSLNKGLLVKSNKI